jgi:2-hydroxychromene-2-carboxylate isomerase
MISRKLIAYGRKFASLMCMATLVFSLTAVAADVVPDLPPVPDAASSPPPKDNWNWKYYDDTTHSYKNEDNLLPPPAPLTDIVTPENPLQVDVFYSMRSPYSYLVLQRLTWLNSNYNVDVNIKVIFPVAVRTPGMFGGGTGDKNCPKGGRWYKWADTVNDTRRVGQFQGVPYRFADPDPILQDTYPPGEASGRISPLDEQPYIAWLVRLASAAQLQGKSLEYVNAVSPLIWGARVPPGEWPNHVEAAVNSIGMDYDATIKDIQKNPEKYDAVWMQNQEEQMMTGHGGVPNMSFRGEPFFGQDRFDHLVWRLNQNGLTKSPGQRPPLTTKPLRWPNGL